MITLEKLLLLKALELFKYTPEDILLQVATVVKERTVSAGETILRKGDVGTTMYMIVNGSVKVHDEDILITELGEKQVFGELSALDPEQRVASVTALTDCLLLSIDSETLYEIIDVHMGLAKGIIQALCRRTRSISKQLQQVLREQKNKI